MDQIENSLALRYLTYVVGVARTADPDRRTDTLFRKLVAITRQSVSKAAPERVHQLRTTIRRVETLIATHALADHRGVGKLTKKLGRLRRRAGKVRDLDVQLVALRSIQAGSAGGDRDILAKHIEKARLKTERKLLAAIENEMSHGLRKRVERAARLTLKQPANGPRQDFAAQARNKFQQLVKDHPPLTENNLHDFRMQCKRIRYLAEMSDTPEAQKLVRALKRVQDAIGEWHDWLTLVATAEEVIAKGASPLIAVLRARRQSKFHDALRTAEEAKRILLPRPTEEIAPTPGRTDRKRTGKVVELEPPKAKAAAS